MIATKPMASRRSHLFLLIGALALAISAHAAANGFVHTNGSQLVDGQGHALNLFLACANIDADYVSLLFGFLETLKLTLDHGGFHVVACSSFDPLHQNFFGCAEIDEVNLYIMIVVACYANNIPVFLFECAAR